MDHPELQNAAPTEAEKVLAEHKAIRADLEAAETSASGWIKRHVAWIWGLTGLFVGYIAGFARGHWHP